VSPDSPITTDWIENHFDIYSPDLAGALHDALAHARNHCPVAWSDRHKGFWVLSRYNDVLRVAQDWQTFSSELGIGVPRQPEGSAYKILPVTVDPPVQRTFKRLINAYFTPAAIAGWEVPTRDLAARLIDGFADRGSCEFMAEFARPFPGLAFFDLALHAPSADLEQVNHWATMASVPGPDQGDHLMSLAGWIGQLLQARRRTGPVGDVIDGVMAAEIEGRPITEEEAIGTVQLLVLGGLETTAGVLGMAMQRFCRQPEIPARLKAYPALIPAAVEELLRLDGSFVCIGRTARTDAEISERHVSKGDPVVIYWASANRDEAEFERPDEFLLDRPRNRHLAFGAGPHRCTGSNLARLNLQIAIKELVRRLQDFELQDGPIEYHSSFNRAPLAVPIAFKKGG
jgi:cytochrome P450